MAEPLRFVGISGSLRRASTNTGLLRCAAEQMGDDATLDILDIHDLPLYNADFATGADRPAAADRIIAAIAQADGLVLACTEYNYSIAPALKNVIDWASREPENRALSGKPVALMGSAGGMGSSRSQYHVRQVCVFCNLLPLAQPEVFANAFTDAFDANGNVVDDKLVAKISAQMQALKVWTRKIR
ncbi:NADPH-dependent FMN reductase [Chitinibacteraceae bacterium HSL-7]